MSQKSAADQIWKDFLDGKLKRILKKSLLSGIGPEIASHVTMSISIMKEEYESACDILAGKTIFSFSVLIKDLRSHSHEICNELIFKKHLNRVLQTTAILASLLGHFFL